MEKCRCICRLHVIMGTVGKMLLGLAGIDPWRQMYRLDFQEGLCAGQTAAREGGNRMKYADANVIKIKHAVLEGSGAAGICRRAGGTEGRYSFYIDTGAGSPVPLLYL